MKTEPKKIYVKTEDFGYWTQKEIPVVRYEEYSECCGSVVTESGFCLDCRGNAVPVKEIVYCNHAGAEAVQIEREYPRIDHPDITWEDTLYECSKCGAFRFDGTEDWQNAPSEGRHE